MLPILMMRRDFKLGRKEKRETKKGWDGHI